jgi:hypothetical protein
VILRPFHPIVGRPLPTSCARGRRAAIRGGGLDFVLRSADLPRQHAESVGRTSDPQPRRRRTAVPRSRRTEVRAEGFPTRAHPCRGESSLVGRRLARLRTRRSQAALSNTASWTDGAFHIACKRLLRCSVAPRIMRPCKHLLRGRVLVRACKRARHRRRDGESYRREHRNRPSHCGPPAAVSQIWD